MNNHRYILEPYNGMSTRYRCPSCQQNKRTFTRYIDIETGKHLHSEVGRCDRENNCGYHMTPKHFFEENPTTNDCFDYQQPIGYATKNLRKRAKKEPSYIEAKLFKESLKEYKFNYFVQYLISLFGAEITSKLVCRYFIGTSKHWEGATVFWQIDLNGKIRTGKIMLYEAATGKRVKKPINHVHWVHKALKIPDYGLNQCLFGEHLLKDKTKTVAIVESEKTAIIASVYLPRFIWLAVGGLSSFSTITRCNALKGRKVVLFPDLNGFDKWTQKADEHSRFASFIVSDLLERKATKEQKAAGLDLADYLVRLKLEDFIRPERVVFEKAPLPLPSEEIANTDNVQAEKRSDAPDTSWAKEIDELEKYFGSIQMPNTPLKLNAWTTIQDVALFVEANLCVIKANQGNKAYWAYLNRLQEAKECLINNA